MTVSAEEKKMLWAGLAAVILFIILQIAAPVIGPWFGNVDLLPLFLLVGFGCAAMSFAIFHQGWLMFSQILTRQKMLTSALFLLVCLLDMFYTLSLGQIKLGGLSLSPNAAQWLLLICRAICAEVLFIVYGLPDRPLTAPCKNISVAVSFATAVAVCGAVVLLDPVLPPLLQGSAATLLGTVVNLCILAVYLSVTAAVIIRYKTTSETGLLLVARGIIFCAVGELFFLNAGQLMDMNSFGGLLCNFAGFYMIHKGLYRLTIEAPMRQKQLAEEQINFIAFHDDITGLPNRRRLALRLADAMDRAMREEEFTAILILNMNRFRNVNDSLGYHAGDQLLQIAGDHLLSHCRTGEEAFSMGGDEFAYMITGFSNSETAVERIENLLSLFKTPVLLSGSEYHASITVGMALFPHDGDTAEQLIQNAITAVHDAKDHGVEFRRYAHSMQMKAQERLKLENDLRKGLERSEFHLVYQPRVNLASGLIVGMEALVRWNHPVRGLISPADFIPVAEESGLIVPLGEWVLREACRQNKAWQEAGYRAICVSVNLSMRQFRQSNLVETIQSVLQETGLHPWHLEVEITESMTFDKDMAFEQLRRIKEIGVEISIDDFGTGYSSLHYLKDLPIDRLKIDRSFVHEVMIDSNNAAIISTITSMAHHLKLQVTAEGVENEGQLHFLREQRCHEGQGYYFSKPLTAGEFEVKCLHEAS
ncbi:EAL domain-containing protein [Paenibacillus sp. JX-17]|uniref:EAL domain-containing protein n=1 Tax=Paenibacillus lacisoli TaxID=3064525 RepID=A0ABT9CDR8_9BACL|nr:EAL domain-containing protein [Paenibacillus sp. JX-17]MDO7907410.1 EAL domain-containing protein [Paenibacillus sp. JX-17]